MLARASDSLEVACPRGVPFRFSDFLAASNPIGSPAERSGWELKDGSSARQRTPEASKDNGMSRARPLVS
jgi:hypothetical protein